MDMTDWEDLYNNLFITAKEILNLENNNLSLAITWVDKPEALKLNQEYRHQEYVPDVISFPTEMDEELVKEMGEHELGDLFICYDVALEKADKYHHNIYEEMAFLFVHGFLHLLGYDHDLSLEDEKEMFTIQDKILKAYNINYEVIYDDEDYL
ncbi:rRNA maturation RNase YbeY [Mesoplasma lactucae]|nr:rRNA maturation RNase YbeY [Mesoplasma lactucae]